MNQQLEDTNNLYASIDLGSNSFHMIVAREADGQLQIIDKHKEMVRLRAGLDKKYNLSKEIIEASAQALERFAQLIKNVPNRNIRVVGTNTLRNAKNSREFLLAARKALGINIDIVSGKEEARLIYLGVSNGLPSSDEQRLVMDIGGGSSEYIIGAKKEILNLTSTEIGCVTLSQMFFEKDIVTPERMRNAVAFCSQALRPHRRYLTQLGWENAYGSSGTIKSIASVLQANGWADKAITLEGLNILRGELIKAGSAQDLELDGLKDDRRSVLAGGLAVLIASFEELQISQLHISNHALREGLILDSLGRATEADSRLASVKTMQKWLKVDRQHADQVAQTARAFFNQVHTIWNLHDTEYDYPKLLSWASQLHECGIAISYKRYRQHSAYLVENTEMAGFSNQEKQMLGAMLLNHRGKFIFEAFEQLIEPHNKKLIFLTVLLRLAVRIHRGRDLEFPEVWLEVEDNYKLSLKFEENWLEAHPLSVIDLEIEAKRLAEGGFKLSFS